MHARAFLLEEELEEVLLVDGKLIHGENVVHQIFADSPPQLGLFEQRGGRRRHVQALQDEMMELEITA